MKFIAFAATIALMWTRADAIELTPMGTYCMADFVFLGVVTNVELQRGTAEACKSTKLPATMFEYEEREEKDCGQLVYSAKVVKVLSVDQKHTQNFLGKKEFSVYFQFTDMPSKVVSVAEHMEKARGTRFIFPIVYLGGLFRFNAGYEWGLGYPRPASEEPNVSLANEAACKRLVEISRKQ